MTSSTSFNPEICNSSISNEKKESMHRYIKPEVYERVLTEQLEKIIDQCKRLGHKEANAERALDEVSELKAQKEKDIIANGPIFLAILVVLFTGENSTYRVLTKKMDALNGVMRQIGEISDKMKDLTNQLSNFMEENDPVEMKKIASKISNLHKELNEVIENNKDSIGDDLLKRLEKFSDSKIGTLDNLLEKAQTGVSSWEELAQDEGACQKLHDYLTAATGGSVGEGTSVLLNEVSQLQGALNVQNQGQLERLNLITKKVDAATKLFSSCITMFKGISQTLTNYSGL